MSLFPETASRREVMWAERAARNTRDDEAEECAKIAEAWAADSYGAALYKNIADAIRARIAVRAKPDGGGAGGEVQDHACATGLGGGEASGSER